MSHTRTIEEAEHLISLAVEILRSHSDGRAVDVESRVNFQRGRSQNTDYLDWACWFLRWGERLPNYLVRPFAAHLGRVEPTDSCKRLAPKAVEVFMGMVPEELWKQGEGIEL